MTLFLLLGGQIIYTYDAFENLLSTRDPAGSTTVMVYDLRGRKIEMTDPNMGRWKYSYNVLGELVRQEDAKGQVVTMQYDLLGRMVQRTEAEGTTDWVYDTAWKGALTSVSSPDYIRSYTYTPFGAVASETTSVAAVAPPAAPPASSTPLQNGQPVSGQSGSAGTELRFTLNVPLGATGLKIYMYGGNGDADLYVKLGSAPTPASYGCRSISNSNNDTCDLGNAQPGTYHVLVRGYSSFSGLSVVGTYAYGGGAYTLQNGVPVNNIAGYSGAEWRYVFDVPEGAAQVRFETRDGSGNSELYVRYGAEADTASYDCRSDSAGNNAVCDSSTAYSGAAPINIAPFNGVPPPGRYHVLVRGVTSFFGASLTATYSHVAIRQPPPVNPPPVEPPCLSVKCILEIKPPEPPPCTGSCITELNTLNSSFSEPPLPAPPAPENSLKDWFEPIRGFFGWSVTSNSTTSNGFESSASGTAAMLNRTLSYTYDSLGRPSEITYPSGLKVRNAYNANGAWDSVSNSASGLVYWRAQNWDEWGSAYQTTLGNGVATFLSHDPGSGVLTAMMTGPGGSSTVQSLSYQWDARGNLLSRNDNRAGLQETFSYDGLDRLSSNRLYGVPGISGGTSTLALSYAANGNILSKTGMGSYTYGTKPQAVTQAGWMSYSYDANGNMQTAGARSYTWTSYNLPSRIQESDSATDFLYGPERQRIRQSSSSSARGGRLTYFFHALYEEQAYSSYTEQKHHIATPQGVVAIETKGPTNKTEYLHRDHLGSIDAITNASGQVTQRLSFDAFGKRRGESWELKTTQPDFYTNWGYTGHQQQDDFGLIHMKGRVYDPSLGRFISADPFIQAPENTQSYNRYSYAMNNPLSHTDPSGFGWKKFWKKWWRPIVAIVVSVVTYGAASAWASSWVIAGTFTLNATTVGVIAGAAAGAVGGAILTGTWQGALRGAAAGAVTGGIAGYFGDAYTLGRVAADSVGGGIGSELNGGSFRRGALTAFTMSAVTYAAVSARQYELAHSQRTPGQVGESPGFRGVEGKVGGGRINADEWKELGFGTFDPNAPDFADNLVKYYKKADPSYLGGHQGLQGEILGHSYSPGSLGDQVVEAYSGVHDFLNHGVFYNANGTAHNFALGKLVGETINATNVLLASPVVAISAVPDYARWVVTQAHCQGRHSQC